VSQMTAEQIEAVLGPGWARRVIQQPYHHDSFYDMLLREPPLHMDRARDRPVTVSIRPGRYWANVTENERGERRQGPWYREGEPMGLWIKPNVKVLYRLRCNLPAAAAQGERQ
jgi:hypothetical protein